MSNPIDLETMREKVNGNQYSEYQEFIEDIDQLFTNARLYNKVCTLDVRSCTSWLVPVSRFEFT